MTGIVMSEAEAKFLKRPIDRAQVQQYLGKEYRLDDGQVSILVTKAYDSFSSFFRQVDGLAQENGSRQELLKRAEMLHTVKGVLLHLGLVDWASWAATLQGRLEDGEMVDLARETGVLRWALAIQDDNGKKRVAG